MKYVPTIVPQGIAEPARVWLGDELRRIALSLATVDNLALEAQAAEPARYSDGLVLYANATDWNPGDGEGPYIRTNSKWVKLGGGADESMRVKTLRIEDAAGTDFVTLSHDGVDLNQAFTNTTFWNITGLGSGIELYLNGGTTEGLQIWGTGDQTIIRPRNSAGTGWDSAMDFYHDRSSGRWAFDGQVGFFGAINQFSGNTLKLFDSTNADSMQMFHDGSIAHHNYVGTNQAVFETSGTDRFVIDFANDRIISYSPMFVQEQASANADSAGFGQIWIKNTTPCEIWFTDDAGTDHQLAYV